MAVSAVAIGGLGGCGSSKSTEASTRSPLSAGVPVKPKLMIPAPEPARPGKQGCSHTVAEDGADPHVIRMTTRCFAPAWANGAFFSVGLSRPGRPLAAPRIIGVSRVLRAAGPGVAHAGRCRLIQGRADCAAKFKGYAQLTARLIVDTRARCVLQVSATSVSSPPCRERNCFGDPRLSLFFHGIPRGCRGGSGGSSE